MSKNETIPFAIKTIVTEEFATIESNYKEKEEVTLESGFKFGINKEEHTLAVRFELSFLCEKGPFIILKASCHFDIEPKAFQRFLDKKSNQYIVPKDFFIHLSVLTVGTARGILHAKLDNTKFDQFVLPTMNIAEMIEEDVVFE